GHRSESSWSGRVDARAEDGQGGPTRLPRLAVATALSWAALQGALLALVAWDKSDTADEPSYIVGGMFQWVWGDYLENCHAPPLPRWGYAAALRVVDPDLFTVWRQSNRWTAPDPLFTRSAPDLRRNLFATRLT